MAAAVSKALRTIYGVRTICKEPWQRWHCVQRREKRTCMSDVAIT